MKHLFKKGYKMSEETKRKIGEANKISLLGNIPWHKGKKLPDYYKKSLSEAKKRNPVRYWLGKERSFEDRKKMSEGRKGLTAKENHPNWKGGVSSIFSAIRNSFEYKEWRKEIFRRDKWTCVFCGYRSKGKIKGTKFSDIEADHIESFSKYPNLRFNITNGRTLCVSCHKKVTFKKL